MPFKQNGLTYVTSDPAPIRIGGVLPIGLDAKAAGGYNPVFRTKLYEDGVDAKGKPFYRTEVIKYNSAKDASNALTDGTIIATGSTKPGEKNFEFNENASDVDKGFKERIYTVQKRQVDEIAKDEGTGSNKRGRDKGVNEFKKGVKEFGVNSTQDNPIESVNAPVNAADQRKGIGRKGYGVLFYPSFIQQSQQDKLKITVLKQATRFTDSQKAQQSGNGIKRGQGGRPLGDTTYRAGGYKAPKNIRGGCVKNNKNKTTKDSSINTTSTLDNRRRPEFGKRTLGHITLPIPNGVTDTNKVNFGSGTLNPFQVVVAGAALKTLLKGLGSGAEEAGKLFAETAKNPDLKPALANLITSSVVGVDNNELLARGDGTIINNNLELLFKGPTLRPFTFQFVFSPRDIDESKQVSKIIRCFKQSSAVQRTPGGIFLAAPNTYRLQFLSGEGPHKFLPKIKECALLSVSVNYMPENSYMTYEDSSMVAYSVNLAFQELEPIFNNDYDDLDIDTGFSQGVGPLSSDALTVETADSGGIGF